MKKICIIPARGGSKRIPRKNIKNFFGKPILAYSIETAIKSHLFQDIVVSTDDQEIANIAQKFGASVPFFRSKETSNDYSPLKDVIEETIKKYEENNGPIDIFCCLLATAPFVTVESLSDSYNLLINNNYESIFSVKEFSSPIQRSLKINNGKISMVWPEYQYSRSQDLESRYHDAGQFYWMHRDIFINKLTLWTENTGSIVLPEIQVQDIDTEQDWLIAEFKYKFLNNLL